MHQSEKSITTDGEVSESATLPEDGHAQEGIPNEQRNHADQRSGHERSRLGKTGQHRLISLRFQQVS